MIVPGPGRLFAEAGRRAFHQGAASSAVTLLDKALELLPADGDARVRADAVAALLYALVEAGQVERAMTSAAELEQVTAMLDRPVSGASCTPGLPGPPWSAADPARDWPR